MTSCNVEHVQKFEPCSDTWKSRCKGRTIWYRGGGHGSFMEKKKQKQKNLHPLLKLLKKNKKNFTNLRS